MPDNLPNLPPLAAQLRRNWAPALPMGTTAVNIEALQGRGRKYADPLVAYKNFDLTIPSHREAVARLDPLAFTRCRGFAEDVFAEAPKFYEADQVDAPEVAPELRQMFQLSGVLPLLTDMAEKCQVHGWVVAKIWFTPDPTDPSIPRLSYRVFSEVEIPPEQIQFDALGDPVVWQVNQALQTLPLGRTNRMRTQSMVLHRDDPTVIHFCRGSSEATAGFGMSALEPVWDPLAKLREISTGDFYRSKVFPTAIVPPDWTAEEQATFAKQMAQIDTAEIFLARAGVDNAGNAMADLPNMSFITPGGPASGSASRGSGIFGGAHPEWMRLCGASRRSIRAWTGNPGGALAAANVDSENDLAQQIRDANMYRRLIIMVAMRYQLALGVQYITPLHTCKTAIQWREDERLLGQIALQERQFEMEAQQRDQEGDEESPKGKKKRGKKPESDEDEPPSDPDQDRENARFKPNPDAQQPMRGPERLRWEEQQQGLLTQQQQSSRQFNPVAGQVAAAPGAGTSQSVFQPPDPSVQGYVFTPQQLAAVGPQATTAPPTVPNPGRQTPWEVESNQWVDLGHSNVKRALLFEPPQGDPEIWVEYAEGHTYSYPVSPETGTHGNASLSSLQQARKYMVDLQNDPAGAVWDRLRSGKGHGGKVIQAATGTSKGQTPTGRAAKPPHRYAAYAGKAHWRSYSYEGQGVNPPIQTGGTPSGGATPPPLPGQWQDVLARMTEMRDTGVRTNALVVPQGLVPAKYSLHPLLREHASITQAAAALHKGKQAIYNILDRETPGERINETADFFNLQRCNRKATGNGFNVSHPLVYFVNNQVQTEYVVPDAVRANVGVTVPLGIYHADEGVGLPDEQVVGTYKITGFDATTGKDQAEIVWDNQKIKEFFARRNEADWVTPLIEAGYVPDVSTAYTCSVRYNRAQSRYEQHDIKLASASFVQSGNCARGACDWTPLEDETPPDP